MEPNLTCNLEEYYTDPVRVAWSIARDTGSESLHCRAYFSSPQKAVRYLERQMRRLHGMFDTDEEAGTLRRPVRVVVACHTDKITVGLLP